MSMNPVHTQDTIHELEKAGPTAPQPSLIDILTIARWNPSSFSVFSDKTIHILRQVNHALRCEGLEILKNREAEKTKVAFTYLSDLLRDKFHESNVMILGQRLLAAKTEITSAPNIASIRQTNTKSCQICARILNSSDCDKKTLLEHWLTISPPVLLRHLPEWLSLDSYAQNSKLTLSATSLGIHSMMPYLTTPPFNPVQSAWLDHICDESLIPFEKDLLDLTLYTLHSDELFYASKLANIYIKQFQEGMDYTYLIEHFIEQQQEETILEVLQQIFQNDKKEWKQYIFRRMLENKKPLDQIFDLIEKYHYVGLELALKEVLLAEVQEAERRFPLIEHLQDTGEATHLFLTFADFFNEHLSIEYWISALKKIDSVQLIKDRFLNDPEIETLWQKNYDTICQRLYSQILSQTHRQSIQELYICWTRPLENSSFFILNTIDTLRNPQDKAFMLQCFIQEILKKQPSEITTIFEEIEPLLQERYSDPIIQATICTLSIETISSYLNSVNYDDFEKRVLTEKLLAFAARYMELMPCRQQEQTILTLFTNIRRWSTAPHDWKWHFLNEAPALFLEIEAFPQESLIPTTQIEIKAHTAIMKICSALDFHIHKHIHVAPFDQELSDTCRTIEQIPLQLQAYSCYGYVQSVSLHACEYLQGYHHFLEKIQCLGRNRFLDPDSRQEAMTLCLTEQTERIKQFDDIEIQALATRHIQCLKTQMRIPEQEQKNTSSSPCSQTYISKIKQRLKEYTSAIGLALSEDIRIDETDSLDTLITQLVYQNKYLLLPPVPNLEGEYEQLRESYNTKAKAILITQAERLGLKLPKTLPGISLQDRMSSKEIFMIDLAYRNRFAFAPEGHALCESDFNMGIFAGEYHAHSDPLKTGWMSFMESTYPSALQLARENKFKLNEILYLDKSPVPVLGSGSSKIAKKALIIKPDVDMLLSGYRGAIPKTKIKCLATTKTPSSSEDSLLGQECSISRTLREARVPNILKMHLVTFVETTPTEDIDRYGILSNVCEGGTLHTYLSKTSLLPSQEKKRLAIEICDTIAHMHQARYVHNDLKTSNIYISIDSSMKPHIKLGDFGNTQIEGTLTGYPSTYITPEQYQAALHGKQISACPESDNYCLGEVLLNLFLQKSELQTHQLDYTTLFGKHWIGTRGTMPTADPAHKSTMETTYATIHRNWIIKASNPKDPEFHLAPLFAGLFNPIPITRWTAEQAKAFILLL